jgi:predicted nuclease of predicted toxin-antitoxin system
MTFVVDAQLPPALARWLVDQGFEASHVSDVGLERADDRTIWSHAEQLGAAIVTKDEDFAERRMLAHDGPSVVWIRFGNTTRPELIQRLERLMPSIVAALERGETLVEIR